MVHVVLQAAGRADRKLESLAARGCVALGLPGANAESPSPAAFTAFQRRAGQR